MYQKRIAKAIQNAHERHKESYNEARSEYALDWEFCFQEACKDQKLPDQIWYVLYLANHWYNDLRWWAEEILANRNMNIMDGILARESTVEEHK